MSMMFLGEIPKDVSRSTLWVRSLLTAILVGLNIYFSFDEGIILRPSLSCMCILCILVVENRYLLWRKDSMVNNACFG